ncbi:MAG: hypothetical protein N2440_01070 [Actinobacteria bacterium]|nr:hypothetical protein [Actinomycetota bacterium]
MSTEEAPEKNSEKVINSKSRRPSPVLDGKAFDVGSMWIYETLDATLTIKVVDKYIEKNKDVYVYDFYYGGEKVAEEHRLCTKEYLAKLKSVQGESKETIFKEPLILYKFPLRVGKKWTNRFEIQGVNYISEVEVLSYEKLKTKSGIYFAYKIRHKTYPQGLEKEAIIDTDWYNPEIGLIAYSKEGGENPKAIFKYYVKTVELK